MKIFNFIKATNFFPTYAPGVTNWRHKMRGKNGHDVELNFTTEDIKAIRKGVKNMARDLDAALSYEQ